MDGLLPLPGFSSDFEPSSGGHQRKGQMRKSFKSLFAPTPKFQKTMKRGVYLGCFFYNEERRSILVTNDDNLPIVAVSEGRLTFPNFAKSKQRANKERSS